MGFSLRGRAKAATLTAAAVAVVGAGTAIGVAATSGGDDPQESFASALTEQVGADVTVEDIKAAREQVVTERLDQAVADGRITQEQADQMLERLREGPQDREERRAAREAAAQPIVEALGVTGEELHEARHDGTTLLELAEEKGVSRADLEAAVTESIKIRAEAEGETAPTGDELAERVDEIITSERGPRGHRGPGGPGGFGGPGGLGPLGP